MKYISNKFTNTSLLTDLNSDIIAYVHLPVLAASDDSNINNYTNNAHKHAWGWDK